jgi:hypothetical protein
VFSTSATAPRVIVFVVVMASGFDGSAMNVTGLPRIFSSAFATGFSENASSKPFPFGRPRCDSRITRQPSERRWRIVGTAAWMRVSSPTTPFLMGTLKSTRVRARLPSTPVSRSWTVRLFTASPPPAS